MNKFVYRPKEDSNLFLDCLEKIELKNKKILDMGTGSGVLAEKCLKKGSEFVLAVDINKEALKETKKRLNKFSNLKVKESDLFENINKQNFDYILFNPPYLPEIKKTKKEEKDRSWNGGQGGIQVINKFLDQVKNYLKETGKVLIIISDKTDQKKFKEKCNSLNLKIKKIRTKKLFYEKIFLFELINQE